MLHYCVIVKFAWSEAVESPPTQTSNAAGSSTQDFVAVLQYVSSSFPSEKYTVFFFMRRQTDTLEPFSFVNQARRRVRE